MKTKFIGIAFICLIAGAALTSCRHSRVVVYKKKPGVGNSSKLPPGQAKKINGDQSAKKYAPGQQKKH
jgi:hypothetical protein